MTNRLRIPGITPQKPIKREIIAPTVSGRRRKTHIGTVIYSKGEKSVRLSEGATVWSAGSNEHFDKKTGQRVGSIGRHRLVLESIRPLHASDEQQDAGSITVQQLVSVMKSKTLSYQGSYSAQSTAASRLNICNHLLNVVSVLHSAPVFSRPRRKA